MTHAVCMLPLAASIRNYADVAFKQSYSDCFPEHLFQDDDNESIDHLAEALEAAEKARHQLHLEEAVARLDAEEAAAAGGAGVVPAAPPAEGGASPPAAAAATGSPGAPLPEAAAGGNTRTLLIGLHPILRCCCCHLYPSRITLRWLKPNRHSCPTLDRTLTATTCD